MEAEVKTNFKRIKNCQLYEINTEGQIRKVYDKSIVFPVDGKVVLWNTYGQKVTFDVQELLDVIFNGKEMESDQEIKIVRIKKDASQYNNNNLKPKTTMSEEQPSETQNVIDPEKVEKIKALSCKKHIKIYKMHQLGMGKKDIAAALSTNAGACYNVIKDYEKTPDKVAKADQIIVE